MAVASQKISWHRAEQATLAAAIQDPGFLSTLLASGEDVFADPTSRRVWQILHTMQQAGQVIDARSVELALGAPLTEAPSQDYWALLLEQRLKRQLDLLGRWLLKPHDQASATSIATRALHSLNQALTATQHGTMMSGADALQAGLTQLMAGNPAWLSSGIPTWDAASASWGPDDLVVVGARPSQGKTALGVQWAWHTASQNRGVVFCSIEMSPASIGLRTLTQAAQMSSALLRQRLNQPEVQQALQQLTAIPLAVMDAGGSSVADMQAAVAQAELQGGRYDVVIIDYLQLIRPVRQTASREQDIARITADLKHWARRDHRLVVALSQLSRKVEERTDRTPTLADLRESGAIEQAADGVVFIHRLDAGDAVDLIVAKNRNGPTGSIPLRWEGETTRFLVRGF